MNQDYNSIDPSKFEFAGQDDIIKDKKLDTKPIGYFKDALYRFAKNKASVTAFVIICILFLFAIFSPILFKTNYTESKNDTTYLIYTKLLPKNSLFEGTGFWDGTKKNTINQNTYNKYMAMGKEVGMNPIIKVERSFVENGFNYYDVRLDTYVLNDGNGMKYLTLTLDEYQNIQKFQDKTGIQVIYPAIYCPTNPTTYNNTDAFVYYSVNQKGMPNELDENGYAKPRYATATQGGSADLVSTYTSIRIAGDPGIEDPNSPNAYVYAKASGTADNPGYTVRIYTYNYFQYKYGYKPCFAFGTDNYGYDIITRLGTGARLSFMLAIFVSVINLTIGAFYGSIEGYYGGKTDLIMERVRDILGGVPFMVVTTLFQLHFAKKVGAIPSLLFAFITTGWLGMAGTVRMQFYRFKNQEYILAARTLGASDFRLMFKHIFPNSLGTIITGCVLVIPGVIFSESSLTYLGIVNLESGSTTSVGTMLAHGKDFLATYPHIILFPALFISLLMITFNLFGNGLRDAFNPSLRGSGE